MKTSAHFQLPARPFLLILFCVHAALYVLQLGDYCHRGKTRSKSQILLARKYRPPPPPLPPPSCVLFLVPLRRGVLFFLA